jgi:hypothetical protein
MESKSTPSLVVDWMKTPPMERQHAYARQRVSVSYAENNLNDVLTIVYLS